MRGVFGLSRVTGRDSVADHLYSWLYRYSHGVPSPPLAQTSEPIFVWVHESNSLTRNVFTANEIKRESYSENVHQLVSCSILIPQKTTQ